MSIGLHSPTATGRTDAIAGNGLLAVAGFASLGAGAVHAAAIGTHGEHRQAVVTFAAVATVQLGWGAVALVRQHRWLASTGAVLNGGALVGWVVAKTTGLGAIGGLEAAEPVQRADAIAAGLAAVAVLIALRGVVGSYVGRPTGMGPRRTLAVGLAVVVLATGGMVAAGEHGHGDGPGDRAHAHDGDEAEPASAVAPTPYHPDLPIDLGGVDGVTPQEQARAENLVAVTLARLPQFADPAHAERQGFRSIGDGATGHEHYMHAEYVADDVILDPDRPESLVYDTTVTPKRLVSAMFMLEPGATLDDVPELGGALTQWHIHDNLCFTASGQVGGLRQPGGPCGDGLVKGGETPMIHVWITPHPCGPFAALEGIGAGTVAEGEERRCDHAHGAPEKTATSF